MAWKAEQDRGLTPVPDFKKGDLSLTRNRGREEDRGDYVCTLQFQNGATLNRTVHVNVLQSKSKQIALYKPSSALLSDPLYQIVFPCSLVIAMPSFIFLMSSFFAPS